MHSVELAPDNIGPRWRRWFRFSLRTLLVAITLLSIVLGLYISRVQNERRAAQARVPGSRAGAERTRAGADRPGDVARRETLWAFGADAGGGVADESPAAASTGATASLTTPAGASAAAGLDGGATGGELVGASAAAVLAAARLDAEETAANARSTAGCVAAAASGETALICATAALMVADTSAAPGVVPAA